MSILNSIVEILADRKPDLLILGGDYVFHYEKDPKQIFEPFKELELADGMLAVMGNHDTLEDDHGIRSALEGQGFTLLDNSSISIQRGSSSIEVSGVPDYMDPFFSDTGLKQEKEGFRVLVSHNPDYLVDTRKDYDLGLAGHSHGGQITFFGIWAPILPVEHKEIWKGQHHIGGRDIIISNGIGTVGLPLRFFAPPEISFITLRRKGLKP